MKIIEDSLRDLWDNIKRTNIQIIGVPEEEEKKKGTEKILKEIIVENLPNMDNLEEMDTFLEMYNFQGLNQEEKRKYKKANYQ